MIRPPFARFADISPAGGIFPSRSISCSMVFFLPVLGFVYSLTGAACAAPAYEISRVLTLVQFLKDLGDLLVGLVVVELAGAGVGVTAAAVLEA